VFCFHQFLQINNEIAPQLDHNWSLPYPLLDHPIVWCYITTVQRLVLLRLLMRCNKQCKLFHFQCCF
jgi:hypothetical protein